MSPRIRTLITGIILVCAVGLIAALAGRGSGAPIWGGLPTVTPPGPGEPTLPPEALSMRAAPTATLGSPPIYPSFTPAPTWPPTSTPIPPATTDNVPMVEVPAGEFIMGITVEQANLFQWHWDRDHPKGPILGFDQETPQLVARLDTFSIDQVEVTNARYRRCVQAGVCEPPRDDTDLPAGYHDNPRYDDYPVQGARWTDANAYCQWVGKRLPTEAEWEKAARGTDGRLFPWGTEGDPRNATNREVPQPVGSYPAGASPYGVLDMLGNAPEWTADWSQPYPGYVIRSPWDIKTLQKQYKVVRGEWSWAHSALIPSRDFESLFDVAGFRCVKGPTPPSPLDSIVVRTTAVQPLPPAATVDLSGMVYVPAGEFVMGTDVITGPFPEEREDERPRHIVRLDAFYIDRFPVTYARYVEFLNALGHHIRACNGATCVSVHNQNEGEPPGSDWSYIHYQAGRYFVEEGYENYAVAWVSWKGARAYCEWQGKRLPTEAEWEKAARGTDGRRYPWGNEWDEAWKDVIFSPHELGYIAFNVSPYGAHDMLGYTGEWVADRYAPDYYAFSPLVNPPGPVAGKYHVMRGYWDVTARDRNGIGGFRCACTPGQDK